MRTYDLTPLFRSSGRVDRWNDLFDTALRPDDSAAGYPPYNIEKMGRKVNEKMGDDKYRIMMAVAGFGENDIEITAQENSARRQR